jgi:hypothetical protein
VRTWPTPHPKASHARTERRGPLLTQVLVNDHEPLSKRLRILREGHGSDVGGIAANSLDENCGGTRMIKTQGCVVQHQLKASLWLGWRCITALGEVNAHKGTMTWMQDKLADLKWIARLSNGVQCQL